MEKTNTHNHAKKELEVLLKTVPDAIIRHFVPEILALCEAFGKSGQSGGSAPYTAGALSAAIKKLCLQKPICPITGIDEEWVDVSESMGRECFQNIRLSSVFKDSKDGKSHYLEAIIFKGQNGTHFTSNGSVKLKDGSTITSSQYIRFPFKPKTFYIDVIETEWADKDEKVEKKGGGWWTSVVKDESQLKEVFEYYDKYNLNK